MMFKTDTLSEKLRGVADAALIFSEENRRYFSQFSASDGVLLVSENTSLFFTDSRYTEAAKNTLGEEFVRDSSNLYDKLREIFETDKIKRIALENDRLTLAQFDAIKNKLSGFSFDTTDFLSNTVNDLRAVKTEDEIKYIKQAQKIAENAFSHILTFIKEGMTEKQISLELDYYMLSHGADALSFETIAVAGKNSSKPHGVPGCYKVQKGDFITMDYGAVVNGYHSDMTRTVALGEVSDKQKKVYDTVLKAQCEALKTLKQGLDANKADKTARDIIEKNGFGKNFGHGLGHGVGIEIHETPSLSPRSDYILKAGNIVTVEPGIYLEGEFGVRIEDMALITESGYENLTSCPKELIIL